MNALNIIAPYRYLDMWVFDDPRVGLSAEPFVGGADVMIDRAVANLPNPAAGFIMLFSASSFPGHAFHLEWRRTENDGNVYYCRELDAEGWLCPALFRYFEQAPSSLYIQVKAKPPAI